MRLPEVGFSILYDNDNNWSQAIQAQYKFNNELTITDWKSFKIISQPCFLFCSQNKCSWSTLVPPPFWRVPWSLNQTRITVSGTNDISKFTSQSVHGAEMHISLHFLPQFVFNLILLVLLLLFLLVLLNQFVSQIGEMLPLEVQVNQVAVFVLALADNADLLLSLDFL